VAGSRVKQQGGQKQYNDRTLMRHSFQRLN
jgi:hypothetical protein